jgi:hypothetical protein
MPCSIILPYRNLTLMAATPSDTQHTCIVLLQAHLIFKKPFSGGRIENIRIK